MTSADYDDFSDDVSCLPDDKMGSLDQLQRYQLALRYICPLLDAYESVTLMQIIDRTAGWKRHAAYFSVQKLLWGDRLYGGISRQMHQSKLMKVLASLEKRGVISRTDQEYHSEKIYRINYDVDLEILAASAPEKRKRKPVSKRDLPVSNGDQPVREKHSQVSGEEISAPIGDPIEEDTKNDIRDNNIITRQRLAPSDPIAARSPDKNSDFGAGTPKQPINPRPRKRIVPIDNER